MQQFGAILDDFELWRQISLKWINIFKIGKAFGLPQFFPCLAKKSLANFGQVPLTTRV